MNLQKCKIYYIDLDSLVFILQGKLEIQGWPEDVRFVSINKEVDRRCLSILVNSETFEETPLGCKYPEIESSDIRYTLVNVSEKTFGYSWLSVKANVEKLVKNDDPAQKAVKFREFI